MHKSCPIPSNPRFLDRTGKTFGRLTVVCYAGMVGRHPSWHCRCSCGNEKTVLANNLVRGLTTSCGCFHRERSSAANVVHGQTKESSRSKEWRAWHGMIVRCTYRNSPSYPRYGGRGITVCRRWIESFPTFFADVGPAPSPKHSLGRIDNNGMYEPGNVRWETATQQARNRRSSRLVTHDGTTATVADWAEQLGIDQDTLWARLKRGWSAARSLTTPVRA